MSYLGPTETQDAGERHPGTPDGRENGVQFLPVNRIVSPAESTRQRAYLSCDACRQRKTRCVPAAPGQRQPCQRCVADDRTCQFRSSRASRARRRASRLPKQYAATSTPPSAGPGPAASPPVANGASAGGPSVNPNERGSVANIIEDHSPQFGGRPPFETSGDCAPLTEHQAVGTIRLDREGSIASPAANTASVQPTARGRIIATRLHDTADALDLLTLTAAGVQNEASNAGTQGASTFTQLYATSSHSAHPPGDTWPRPTNDADWKKFILIKKGVLTKLEVVEFVQFYFNVLWPLRPIVHPFYCDKTRYALLAVEEPLLLVCLVTLASRYHILSGAHGEIRSERIHWQAWKFLQKYLQSALWGSPLTRSPGAIVAMLLMIEWHSKSINNPLGLSDGDDYELFSIPESGQGYTENDRNTLSSTNQQRYGMKTLLEKLNIVAPAYRSNKMSWMLLSNAIALAQESDCFERDSRETQGGSSVYEAFKHEWNQLICVFIYLADESLSMRLGLDTLTPGKSIEAVRARFSSSFASLLPESVLWESYYELTLEARKARELLQSLKRAGPAVSASSILPELEHIERGLNRWKRQHAYTPANEQSLLCACIDLEYQYLVMYSFAPASHVLLNDSEPRELGGRPAHNRRPEALRALADRATSASREILATLIDTLEPSKMLKYVPVRCWQFIVAANLHLLKTTLSADAVSVESNDDLRLLKASIVAVRHGSPDDTHMAVRYAQFLGILLDSSHHSSRAETPAGVGEGGPSAYGRGGFRPAAEEQGQATPYVGSLGDFDLPDIVNGLGNIGDLVDWSDGPFGMFGALGFFQNG